MKKESWTLPLSPFVWDTQYSVLSRKDAQDVLVEWRNEGRNEGMVLYWLCRQADWKILRLDKILPSYSILIFNHFLKVVQSRVVLQKKA